MPYDSNAKPSYKHNVDITINRIDGGICAITFSINKQVFLYPLKTEDALVRFRIWMEDIAKDKEDAIVSYRFNDFSFMMFPQRIGQFTQMGQFRIIEDRNQKSLFSGYVDRREFVRTFYSALMSYFEPCLFSDISDTSFHKPAGQNILPNLLYSDLIEGYILEDKRLPDGKPI